ncbi:MAG: hypothetical protein JWQ18_1218 [Conexibacter sp.]|nr:hypothetical protein [Conexibacter sp.]
MPRRSLPWVLAVLAALICAPTAAAATSSRVYSPFAADGTLAPGLRAHPAFGGTCDTGSFVIPGPTVFRCFAGDVIRDPCFADVAGSTAARPVVVCAESPWVKDVVRLRVRGTLDASGGAPAGAQPWALQLASGRRCTFNEGASPAMAGRRENYTCDAGRFLFGTPDRGSATWRIRQASSPRGDHLRTVAIATAWS